MTTEEIARRQLVVHRYTHVARAVMLGCGMERRSCISAARVTTLVMNHYWIEATPIPVSLIVEFPKRRYAYVSGFSEAWRQEQRARAASWIDAVPDGPHWAGHLVVVAANHLIDAAIDQAESPAHGVNIDPCVLTLPLEPERAADVRRGETSVEAEVAFDDGEAAKIQYEPLNDQTWLETDAWKRDPALLAVAMMIVRRMQL